MRALLLFIILLLPSHAIAQIPFWGYVPYPYFGFGPTNYYAPNWHYNTRRSPRISNEDRHIRDLNTLIAKEKLEQAKRDIALQKKERREELHKPQQPQFVVDGISYPSYDAFKRTQHYQKWKAWHTARNYWEDQKKKIDADYYARQRKELFKKLNEHEKLNWYEKRRVEANRRAEEFMGRPGPWMREQPFIPPSEKEIYSEESTEEAVKETPIEDPFEVNSSQLEQR